ncbi:group XV phospholipase A2-like isoform X3 [Stylophora pistillata]|uniref:group XV phospholipase A2-like isoform X3 n=1 Tax=Stylophora pistillata TaxID=50429 RepID=UPI000C03937C|nr:group XV phospholipase A2-like isoform X3 [Stylophora pistillata]
MLFFTALIFLLGDFALFEAKVPIVIVPGDGGSQLQARINKSTVPHVWCEKTSSSWFDLWLSIESMLPGAIECWADNIRLAFNETSQRMGNAPGVEVQVPYFGTTQDSAHEYFANLKALIEDTYLKNNKTQVVLLSHSLGCPYTHHFLYNMSQEWKDTHIKAWVTIAGAWAGSAKLMRIYASGTNLGFPDVILEPLNLRPVLRTYESSAFLMPSKDFWSAEEVIVETANLNYSVGNLERFFHDIQYPDAINISQRVPPVWINDPPNVPLYCLYGTGVPTPEKFVYGADEFPDTFPKTLFGDGDGTVNIRSLKACQSFVGKQKQKVFTKSFSNADHMGIIGDIRVIEFVRNLISSMD